MSFKNCAIPLCLGLTLGGWMSRPTVVQAEGKHDHHGSHAPLVIPEGQPAPTIDLSIEPDLVGGWNLNAAVTNFAFAPERVNQASSTTEGHAHLYINGEKITRLYSSWYYIPSLPAGQHEIRVELNANGHESFIVGGQAVEDTVTLTVSAN